MKRSHAAYIDPMDALRDANPIGDEEQARIAREINAPTAVAALLSRERRAPSTGRTGFARGRIAVVGAAAAAILALTIPPAFGFGPTIVSFFSSSPPDHQTQTVIFSLARDAPPGMDPHLKTAQARLIASMSFAGSTHTLWAAPTQAGGMCYGWSGSSGGCDVSGTVPLSVSWGDGHLEGYIHTRYASSVEIRLRDGSVVRPDLVEVSDPINAAFFAYTVPAEPGDPSHVPLSVAALDRHGSPIASQSAPGSSSALDPLADATVSAKTLAARMSGPSGDATVWVAPTKYGGRCAWLDLGGHGYVLARCKPAGYSFDSFSLQPLSTADDVVVAGTTGPEFAHVILRFADGAEVNLQPMDGFVLYRVPAEHQSLGHQLRELVGTNAAGDPITQLRVSDLGPCFTALPGSTTSANCGAGLFTQVR